LLHPTNMPFFWLTGRKVKTWPFKKGYTGNIYCSLPQCQAHPLHLSDNTALSKVANKHIHRSWYTEDIQVFFGFMVNSNIVVSFHHKMGMRHCLEDKIEWQLKCKIFDVGLCIFGCFNKYQTKARFSHDAGRGGVKPVYTSSR
jgi:hypothetical protein